MKTEPKELKEPKEPKEPFFLEIRRVTDEWMSYDAINSYKYTTAI